jgi:hypothetical protein
MSTQQQEGPCLQPRACSSWLACDGRAVRQIANSGPLLAAPVPASALIPLDGLLIRSMTTSRRWDLPACSSSGAHTKTAAAKFLARSVRQEVMTDSARLAAVLHLAAQSVLPRIQTFLHTVSASRAAIFPRSCAEHARVLADASRASRGMAATGHLRRSSSCRMRLWSSVSSSSSSPG